ncbi:hypothetical protein PLICRDRAFT_175092 [Plicaturopsis crispa FD-325 SS-3]|nr:hypothetical protein PLICRDRAFT_175092 [Plicaturopsis crispa FD-325 SS-3]
MPAPACLTDRTSCGVASAGLVPTHSDAHRCARPSCPPAHPRLVAAPPRLTRTQMPSCCHRTAMFTPTTSPIAFPPHYRPSVAPLSPLCQRTVAPLPAHRRLFPRAPAYASGTPAPTHPAPLHARTQCMPLASAYASPHRRTQPPSLPHRHTIYANVCRSPPVRTLAHPGAHKRAIRPTPAPARCIGSPRGVRRGSLAVSLASASCANPFIHCACHALRHRRRLSRRHRQRWDGDGIPALALLPLGCRRLSFPLAPSHGRR